MLQQNTINNQKAIVFFDGDCALCNHTVTFIQHRDKKNQFQFISLQSPEAMQLLQPFHINASTFNSFLFLENENLYGYSTGVLKVMKRLQGAWPLLYAFIIIPAFLRNAVYKFIAKHRHHFFKQQSCELK
jgi:predicted DCC family thiol-disulfide oxidoreductase YuxK